MEQGLVNTVNTNDIGITNLDSVTENDDYLITRNSQQQNRCRTNRK